MALDKLKAYLVEQCDKARGELQAIPQGELSAQKISEWYTPWNEMFNKAITSGGNVGMYAFSHATRVPNGAPPDVIEGVRAQIVQLIDTIAGNLAKATGEVRQEDIGASISLVRRPLAGAAPGLDKQTFLNLAPEYYMLALFLFLEAPQEYYTADSFLEAFKDERDQSCLVANDELRGEAVRLMLANDALEIVPDPFGPTLWRRGAKFAEMHGILSGSQTGPFHKAMASGDQRKWLHKALINVNKKAAELQISATDFSQTDLDRWAPITIDRANPVVADAAKRLTEATEAIEQDNGYSVTHAQERDAVVADLKGGLEKLDSGIISVGWIERTVNALKIASMRFANTLKGQLIDGAIQAFKEVIKSHAKEGLEFLLHLWPW